MNQKLFLFIFFSFITLSSQLDCGSFSGPTCGDHNTKYNLQCHKFTGDTYCREVEIDDGCTINGSNCQKTETS